ncbi:hypothetical protein SAMN00120144_1437 [Hymenobacter roseosalivarius DSM 11622]|uniref:Uncharacterized protein n=1 Tax=Hymenobacter roseosalivarius DSM 11622 TaxID=645990 RepID=A0A1W1V3F2_9BACT|nr:hypothetical protein [Hymenobacter roseosalivarius]SMB87879.1 hypothetical protein SAMN00120144_1437 [Hymenobacter roseosalivarius DSM 11622]
MSKLIISAAVAACLFFTAGSAVAQTTETTAAPAVATSGIIAPAAFSSDSLQAVQKLFKSRRTGAVLLAVPGGYVFGAGLANVQEGGISSMLIGGVLAGVAINKEARFNKKKESEMLTAYQQGQPLPAYVRKRIKNKHMKGTKPVEATAQRP